MIRQIWDYLNARWVEIGLVLILLSIAALTAATALHSPFNDRRGIGGREATVSSPEEHRAAASALRELVPLSELRAEGTLISGPSDGADPALARLTEPSVMSVVFSDLSVAVEFRDEAEGNGERVCLSDLGPQPAEHRGQRYWLRSC